ncbi:Aldedh-domain-containing protein [Piedraia hortae CBS 480.64]|uniref:aldehyde dehydrogenase (NAD(+)) n=1 Tax=Piedraia hortae CBS 480.64 TaxID=1314780 RepID=A0A6A7BVB9_9PEZI|nr:Aldedh-domain-containing protein [Piedraia hortae CBS 480.64]
MYLISLVAAAVVVVLTLLIWNGFQKDSGEVADVKVPIPDQCKPGWKGNILDSPTVNLPNSNDIQCYAPASGKLLGFVTAATPQDIDRAVSAAAEARLHWSKTCFSERRRVLKTLLKFILDHQDLLVKVACLDSGKTKIDALFGEVLVTVEKLKWTIKHGETALRAENRPTNLLMLYKRNTVQYEPLGVVGACVSWNYPFHNFIGPVISGLFSGNAILVKTSEQTAWSSGYYAKVISSALAACGHDPNLVQAVSCWPETADYFTGHVGIRHLTFIGSRPVALKVALSAAKSLTPLCVELGGKDAAIILDDPAGSKEKASEMQRIASIIMRGVFQSAGQNCIGIERVIAMPQAYDILVEMLQPRIKALRLGDDLDGNVDMGAMISAASFERLETLVAEAVAQGAKLLVGGRRCEHGRYPKGHYFEPTLLTDVLPSMRIAQEELFAPVCTLMRASSVESAIQLANDSRYGLGCSVFGPTTTTAGRAQLQRVAQAMQTGMVAINDFAVYYAVQLPFGGTKESGYGRFAGEEGLRALCNVKSVCEDRWNGLIKTTIPSSLDYPMQSKAWEMGQGVIEVGYGESWTRRFRGLRKMYRGSVNDPTPPSTTPP